MSYTAADAQELRKEMSGEDDKMRRKAQELFAPNFEWQSLEQSPAAEQAKELISDFWEKHGETGYESPGDNLVCANFELPYAVLLAHRDYNDRWPHRPVLAIADLESFWIYVMVDDMYMLHRKQYHSLEQMVDEGLRYLDYEELVHVSDAEWGVIENTAARLLYLSFEKMDSAAWRELMLSTYPLPWEWPRKHGQ